MLFQFIVIDVLKVQAIPSGEVMTRCVAPSLDTAQNKVKFAEYVIDFQELSAAELRETQVLASVEVMTLFPVPVLDTAT